MPATDCVLVLTTLPAEADAEVLAQRLVDERLAACVSLLPPMRSVYRWKGEIEAASERQVLIKTAASRVAMLERRLRELHPYEVPEFVILTVAGGSRAYLDWVAESVGD